MDYDIIIIGAGPGGYEMAAEASSKYKMKTALIEKKDLGGTCLNRGCIPTKTFLHTSKLFEEIKLKGELFGFTGQDKLAVDMLHLQKRKEEVTTELRNGVAKLLKGAGVDVFEGVGSIKAKGLVCVKNNDETRELSGKYIVIAVGSEPDRQESLVGHDLAGVLTSDEILDLDYIPKSLLILGGGVIGMELASVFNALGTEVKILKASSKIFNNMDKEPGQNLKMILKKRGIEIISGIKLKGIEKSDEGLSCIYEGLSGNETQGEERACGEMVLLAKGRRAYTKELIHSEAEDDIKNIELDDRGFIITNDKFMTGVKDIYAIGDCISSKNIINHAQLAHVATAEGRWLLAHLNKKEAGVDLSAVPSCIYTNPEIASVGLDADKCKEMGIAVITKKFPMGANGKSVLSGQERGFIKLVAEEGSGKIIGAVMMCARATDMISIFTEAIVNNLTLEDMKKAMFPHPTFSEGIGAVL